MNMIVSIRARAHPRAFAVDVPNGFVASHSHAPSTPIPPQRSALRARWSTDPVSGRLECRWTSDDDVPDSWRAAHSTLAGKRHMTDVERLAA